MNPSVEMSDKNRTCTNDAMEQIIGNMTAEMKNMDGQYVPLGFTPSTSTSENLNWTQKPNTYINHYNILSTESYVGAPIDKYPQQSFNFTPQATDIYKNNVSRLTDYDVHEFAKNSVSDRNIFDDDCRLRTSQNIHHQAVNNISELNLLHSHHEPTSYPSNRTQLIENLGTWMVPNNSGTYSPFGNAELYKSNVFDVYSDRDKININVIQQMVDESKCKVSVEQSLDEIHFQFSRDNKKPRIVAEVKPMRPSYSDVLTKSVPQPTNKLVKNDIKEVKLKKENKKNAKSDKCQKLNNTLNRNNANIDFKDTSAEKTFSQFKIDKTKVSRTDQLNRKWASLDNISSSQTNKLDDSKKKKIEETVFNRNCTKVNSRKLHKIVNGITDLEFDSKNETSSISKSGPKKSKLNIRPKSNDCFGSNERPLGKRNQRYRKKENHVPLGIVGQKLKQCTKGWWRIFTGFIFWLLHLVSDICSLSLHISRDMAVSSWSWFLMHWSLFLDTIYSVMQRIRLLTKFWEKYKSHRKPEKPEDGHNFAYHGLQHNINMPTTGDEAMKRLLACKGKDPYSILGVVPSCTDDDIKRYYKRQAFLVHPDKNNQPGAEEAFKILVHAFDMIGEPERRASYDRGVIESAQVVQAWSELTELLQQLQQKVEAAANTIRCSACGLRHKRLKIDRPSFAARNCNTCKIHHSAREGDIWAEAKVFGFLWHYYACMEGSVYDITEWAGCQKDSLKHLRPDSHHVQYRIALGKQNNQPRRHTSSHSDKPDLENLLNTLYGQNDSTRRRNKKFK